MDIHKPKAAHSWREFLIEIGTIICGILIALGLEQGVEWLHWREKVEAAEVRLNKELGRAYAYAFERTSIGGCLDRRLSLLKNKVLEGSLHWTPLPPMTHPTMGQRAYVIPSRPYRDAVWKSALADGTAAHMEAGVVNNYSNEYTQIAVLSDYTSAEYTDMGLLNVLNNHIEILPSDRFGLVSRLEQMQVRNAFVLLVAHQIMMRTKTIAHVDETKAQNWLLTRSNTYKACFDLGLLEPGAPPPRLETDGSDDAQLEILR